MWYGMASGLTYAQALDIPFGELLDYMALYQSRREGYRIRNYTSYDEDVIPDVR